MFSVRRIFLAVRVQGTRSKKKNAKRHKVQFWFALPFFCSTMSTVTRQINQEYGAIDEHMCDKKEL
jgi:hypothetical protein